MDILDAQGTGRSRSFTGTAADDEKAADGAEADRRTVFRRPRSRCVGDNAGHHRFRGICAYRRGGVPGDDAVGRRAGRGPLALPGTYQVRLTVDGMTVSRKLSGREGSATHEASHCGSAGAVRSLDEIRDKTSEANKAVIQIRALKDELKNRSEQTKRRARGRGR